MQVRLSIPYALAALSVSVPCARLAGIGVALVASLGKEAHDWTRGEPFSFKDLAADGIGIAALVALTALADR